jgi:DNA invertase Pin-like site-specific DNA recombinase
VIHKYAATHNIEIVGVYEERGGATNSSTERRVAWVQMMMECEETGVCVVILEKLGHLAPDVMGQETALAHLQEKGIHLVSVKEPDLCSTESTRIMMRQLMGGLMQYNKSLITEKLMAARLRLRAKNGRCEGIKPYGEDPNRPEEIATREMIIDLARRGISGNQIARTLNGEGIKPRTASKWHPYTVIGILRIAGVPLAQARNK